MFLFGIKYNTGRTSGKKKTQTRNPPKNTANKKRTVSYVESWFQNESQRKFLMFDYSGVFSLYVTNVVVMSHY